MNSKEPHAALAKYKDQLDRLIVTMNLAFGEGVTNNTSTPEDIVVFPLGVAARDLFEEIHFLVHYGFGHAALRTSRTLYECVVFALYISKHPDTWGPYLDTMHASWANILRNVTDAARLMPEMHSGFLQKFPKYGQGKTIPLDWNDEKTTYNMASNVGISDDFHSLAFGYASAFVHPGGSFVLQRFAKSPEGRLVIGAKSDDNSWSLALRISHDLLINAIRLRTKYSSSTALRQSLTICQQDFSQIWGYAPQLS
ncbi:MAG: DUF5677 domain-containing protein [Candidatus Acidiferrum sp.]